MKTLGMILMVPIFAVTILIKGLGFLVYENPFCTQVTRICATAFGALLSGMGLGIAMIMLLIPSIDIMYLRHAGVSLALVWLFAVVAAAKRRSLDDGGYEWYSRKLPVPNYLAVNQWIIVFCTTGMMLSWLMVIAHVLLWWFKH